MSKIAQTKLTAASNSALAAYDALKSGETKVRGAFVKGLFLSGSKLPPMTYATYDASGLKEPLGKGLEARGVATVGVQLSKWKPVIVLGSHRPAKLAFGAWEHDPKEGENVDTFGERARAALASLTLADGTAVVPAVKAGAKAGKASKRKGKLKAGSRAANALAAKSGGVTPGAVVAANSATQGQGTNAPTAKARQEARENAASVLFAAKAADVLAVLDAYPDDVAKFFALKAQELRDAKASGDAPVKPVTRAKRTPTAPKPEAPKTALAAALAKAKANGKANGAATH